MSPRIDHAAGKVGSGVTAMAAAPARPARGGLWPVPGSARSFWNLYRFYGRRRHSLSPDERVSGPGGAGYGARRQRYTRPKSRTRDDSSLDVLFATKLVRTFMTRHITLV